MPFWPYKPQFDSKTISSTLTPDLIGSDVEWNFLPRTKAREVIESISSQWFSPNQAVSMLKNQWYVLEGLGEYEREQRKKIAKTPEIVKKIEKDNIKNVEPRDLQEKPILWWLMWFIQSRRKRSQEKLEEKWEQIEARMEDPRLVDLPEFAVRKWIKFMAEITQWGIRSLAQIPANLSSYIGIEETKLGEIMQKPLYEAEKDLSELWIEENFYSKATELLTDIGVSVTSGRAVMQWLLKLPWIARYATQSPKIAKYVKWLVRWVSEAQAFWVLAEGRNATRWELMLWSVFEVWGVGLWAARQAAREAKLWEDLVESLWKINEQTFQEMFWQQMKSLWNIREKNAVELLATQINWLKERMIDKPLQQLWSQIGQARDAMKTVKDVYKVNMSEWLSKFDEITKSKYNVLIKSDNQWNVSILPTEWSVLSISPTEKNILVDMYSDMRKAKTPTDIISIFEKANDNYVKLSKSQNLQVDKQFLSNIREIRNAMKPQIMNVVWDWYFHLLDQFAQLKNMQKRFDTLVLKKATWLQENVITVRNLKKLFAPTKNDVTDLFTDFEEFAWVNILDRARVAKGLAQITDDTRVLSLLETTTTDPKPQELWRVAIDMVKRRFVGDPKDFISKFVWKSTDTPRSTYVKNYIDNILNKVDEIVKDDMDIRTAVELWSKTAKEFIDNTFDNFVNWLRNVEIQQWSDEALDQTKQLENRVMKQALKESWLSKYTKKANDIEELEKIAWKSDEASKKREQLIEQLGEEYGVDQFEASDMYDDLINMNEKFYKLDNTAFQKWWIDATRTTNDPMQVRGVWQADNIPQDLLQEAKKYKTADEFVESKVKFYHGTKHKFDEFDNKFLWQTTQAWSSKQAHFFTNKKEIAEWYANLWDAPEVDKLAREVEELEKTAKRTWKREKHDRKLQELEDLAYSDANNYEWGVLWVDIKLWKNKVVDMKWEAYKESQLNDIITKAKKEWYDSVTLKNSADAVNTPIWWWARWEDEISDVIAVFDAKNIKTESQLRKIREEANK